MRNIKRLTAILMCAVMALSVCSCSFVERVVDKVKNDPKKLEKADAEQIFEYLKNEDIESLCALFSPEVKKHHNLELEWEIFFDNLDGNLVSYKSLSYPGEGGSTDKNGEVIDSHISVNYNGVTTDTGTQYKEFGYYHVRVNRNDPDSEGLTVFTMQLPVSGNWISVGGE
ncbi:DUF5104 domain-containing protein [Butyrivibrio sp. AE2032]|uniref:DUF5104 domain-containing protein n=1 Tax=Butyrivibrio sp. AE2032 TaxID=1458463 RepID=UPI000551142F|nr:DUF5104 domain-containing protein [Butyrivibrio sp. AE2032]